MHRDERASVDSSPLAVAVSVSVATFAFLIGVLWLGVTTSGNALTFIGAAVSATASAAIMALLWQYRTP